MAQRPWIFGQRLLSSCSWVARRSSCSWVARRPSSCCKRALGLPSMQSLDCNDNERRFSRNRNLFGSASVNGYGYGNESFPGLPGFSKPGFGALAEANGHSAPCPWLRRPSCMHRLQHRPQKLRGIPCLAKTKEVLFCLSPQSTLVKRASLTLAHRVPSARSPEPRLEIFLDASGSEIFAEAQWEPAQHQQKGWKI